MKKRYNFPLVSAAIIWGIGVMALLTKSSLIFMEAAKKGAPVMILALAAAAAVIIGIIKSKTLFIPTCRENIHRIMGLKSPRIWQCYRPRFFLFLFLMVSFGTWAHGAASGSSGWLVLLGGLELSVSTALFLSWKCFLEQR